jgi:hypothetical protein
MHIGNYIGLVHESEKKLAEALLKIASHHAKEPDVFQTCQLLAGWSEEHVEKLHPFVQKYSEDKSREPDRLNQALFKGPRSGGLGLLRDLHDLWLMASEVNLCWTVLDQAAKALRDEELLATGEELRKQTERQIKWLMTRIKQSAPQSLVVAE